MDTWRRRTGLGIWVILWVCSGAAIAQAENPGAPDPDLLLGPVLTFGSEAEARAACGGDSVVWADRYAGYFYSADEPQFGNTPAGAFACKRAARQGNYWDTSPLSSMSGQPARSFPYRPLYVGS